MWSPTAASPTLRTRLHRYRNDHLHDQRRHHHEQRLLLTIEVQNAAPVAVDDSYTVHAGETLTIAAAAGLLANDSDGDGMRCRC